MNKIARTLSLILLITSFSGHAYNIDEYLKTLNRYSVNTLEEAVSYLPENIRTHFTFIYAGHGLRGTSYAEPGALVFDPDGTFFATFGSPHQALGNEIEIIQFDKASKTFELYALDFPLERNAQGEIIRPKVNPGQCLSCHGADPRLRWGEYDKWEGVYGNSRLDKLSGDELKYFKEFRARASETGPYQYLIFKDEFYPYNEESKEAHVAFSRRPNSYLGFLTTHLNTQSLSRRIQASPFFTKESSFALSAKLLDFCKGQTRTLAEILKPFQIDESELNPLTDGISASPYRVHSLLAYDLVLGMIKKFDDKKLERLLSGIGLKELLRHHVQDLSVEEILYYDIIDSFGSYVKDFSGLCEYLRGPRED